MAPELHAHAAAARYARMLLSALLCIFFLSGAWSHGAVHDMTPKPPRNERELIVKFRRGATLQEKSTVLRNATKARALPVGPRMRAMAGQGAVSAPVTRIELREAVEVDAELARLRANPAVEYVEPNYSIRLFATTNAPVIPNDFEFSKMYALQNPGGENAKTNADVSAPEAWAFTTGNRDLIVAVVDTGIDYLHEDLKENLWENAGEVPGNGNDDDGNGYIDDVYGYDFVSNDSDPFDDNQHGTHVAGTIGAKGNNGIGTVGVCWEVSMMALKAFDEDGNGTVADAIAALTYAVENGARIINASWGLNERSRALEEACQFAADAGVLLVASAGNDRSEAPSYPGSFETVLAVAATDAMDARAGFSNYGPWVDVAAPGAEVFSTLPENSYGVLSGTSMAAPHVSGMAALVLSRFPMYSREELYGILVNSVDLIAADLPIGNGRINLERAVQMDQPLPTARLKVMETVSGFMEVTGTAAGTFFTGYTLNIGAGRSPASWIRVATSTTAVTNALLGRIDSALVPDGPAVVQLVVSNANGQAAMTMAPIRIFNGLISFPFSGDVLAPGKYTLRGTVHGAGKTYEIFYGPGLKPTSWTKIAEGGTGIIDGVLGEWDGSNLTNGYYALRLDILKAGARSEFNAPLIYFENKLKPGWPVYVERDEEFPQTDWRNIRPADLDGDGVSELVLVDAGTRSRKQKLRVYALDGSEMWQRALGYDIPPDMPAIADVDADGSKEIFVDGTNGVVAFEEKGDLLAGWPVETGSANHAKVLADVDGDGAPELIAYAQEYAATQVLESRELFVFRSNGTLLQKWTLPWCGFTNDVQKIYPAVANLDDDPALEIVVPSGCGELAAFDLENAEPKWKAAITGKLLSSPVIGDVDGDGAVDIVVAACATDPGSAAGVYVIDRFGERWVGWPVLEEYSFVTSPALGDLDGDGRLEIVLVDDAISANLHVLQWDGFEADGWPQKHFQYTGSRVGISIADISGDEQPEIVTTVPGLPGLNLQLGQMADYVGGVIARDFSGEIVSFNGSNFVQSLPYEATSSRYHKTAPAVVGDLDGNGKLDVAVASIQDRTYGSLNKFKDRSSLYVWELPASGTVEWAMFGNGVANQGAYLLTNSPAPVPTNVTRAIRDRVVTLEDRELRIDPATNDWNARSPEALSVIAFTTPTNGTVRLEGSSMLVYTPQADFASIDTFQYTVRDSAGVTSSAPVFVRVKEVDDPPTVEGTNVVMNKNSAATIFYKGLDPENASLTYRITTPPANGELWSYPGLGTYYPKAGYSGTDSFSYVANDGKFDSAPAKVTITILNSNNPPEAVTQNVLTKTNRAVMIAPSGEDSDGDPLTYELRTLPLVGTASLEGSQFRYTPAKDYVGSASFTYRAFDGTAYSEDARITVNVIATNATPVARDGSASVQPNEPSELKLGGIDPDGDAITYEVLTEPLHGTLSGTPPDLFYLPRQDYLGPDRFEFRVTDSFATSKSAMFSIQVERSNRPPVAQTQTVLAEVGAPKNFKLDASDPDNDPVRVIVLKGPKNGVLFGSGTNFTYAPKTSVVGVDTFTYKLWDGQKFGNVGLVTVAISPTGELGQPVFTTIEAVDGMVRLNLDVTAGRPFRIEGSTNLVEWFLVMPGATPEGSVFEFEDTSATGEGMRYYRAVRE